MTDTNGTAGADRETIRVALLGTGAIAQIVHLPTLSQMSAVDVIGVCDPEQQKARSIAQRFGIPRVYEDDDQVFRDPEVQGVIICSPTYLHEEQTVAALEAGKHVLVEKPLALTPAGAERVVRAAEDADRSVMIAFNNRYRSDIRALRGFTSGGELGDVFLVKGGLLNRKVRVVRPTWRHRKATAGGGALMDLGVQTVDLCLWLLGYPKATRVVCHTHSTEGLEVEDAAALLVELETGTSLSVEVSWALLAARDRQYLQILGARGSASILPLSVHKETDHGLIDVTPQLAPGRSNIYTATYREQLDHFADVIRGVRECDLPREQIGLMEMITLAYRSAEEGREVVGAGA